MKVVEFPMQKGRLYASINWAYNVIELDYIPKITPAPLFLKGGTLEPGDPVALIHTERSSAGFDSLYLVEPTRLEYLGKTAGEDDEAIALFHIHGEEVFPDDTFICFYMGRDGGNDILLYTNHFGSGRVVTGDLVCKTHEEVPESVKRRFEAVSDGDGR